MADQAVDAAAQLQADLRQLGRLARARLAANDHRLVVADGAADFITFGRDRQIVVVVKWRHAAAALSRKATDRRTASTNCARRPSGDLSSFRNSPSSRNWRRKR